MVDGEAQILEGTVVSGSPVQEGDRVEVAFTGDQVRVFQDGALRMESRLPTDSGGTGVGVAAPVAGQGAKDFRFDAYQRTENAFDLYGRQVASTVDPSGAGLHTAWDLLADGRPAEVIRSSTQAEGPVARTRFEYDPVSGLPTTVSDLLADPDPEVIGDEVWATTSSTYDQRGLLIGTSSPEGSQVDYAYDEAGQLAGVTGPEQTVERYGEIAQPGMRPSEAYEYTAFGELRAVEDAAGQRTVMSIDDRGFTIGTELPDYTPPGGSPVERNVSVTFDDAGRVLSQTDPLGSTTEFVYNTLGLLVAQTDPPASNDPAGVWRYQYDNAGWLREQRDPLGAVTRQVWDDLGRVTATEEIVRQPALVTNVSATSLGDAGGAVWSRTAEGVVSTAAYDLAGRVVATSDADGNATTYGYDHLGRQDRVTGPDGRAVRTVYDLVGNPVVEQAYGPNGTTPLGESRTVWDLDGRMVSTASPRGVVEGFATSYVYDDSGQLVERTTPTGSGQAVTESWGYDELGQATRYTDGRGNTTSQTYNTMGLPEDAIEPAAGPHTAVGDRQWRTSYDAAGRPTVQQAPGGVEVTSTWDELGRLVEQAGSGAQTPTATRSFDYDPAGHMTTAFTSAGTRPSVGTIVACCCRRRGCRGTRRSPTTATGA